MIIYNIKASERDVLENFFLMSEGITPGENITDNNKNEIRFACPREQGSEYILLCRFKNWKEITEEYAMGSSKFPPLDSRLIFGKVIYDGKMLNFPDTFEDVLHYAFRQTGREDIPEPYPEEPSMIARLAYELYKEAWVQNISPKTIQNTKAEYGKAFVNGDFDGSLSEYINEYGYGGQLYVCLDEFLNAEYRDTEYMKELFAMYLTDHDSMEKGWNEYLEDIKKYDLEEDIER